MYPRRGFELVMLAVPMVMAEVRVKPMVRAPRWWARLFAASETLLLAADRACSTKRSIRVGRARESFISEGKGKSKK